MSKMDNLRAMREARYEAAQARAKGAGGATKPASKTATVSTPKPASKKAAAKKAPATEAPATEAACGHRNMSGRTCTRPQGHSEKSHRYS